MTGVKLDPTTTGAAVGTDLYRTNIDVYLYGVQKTGTSHQTLTDSLQLKRRSIKPRRVIFTFDPLHHSETDLRTVLIIRPNTTSVDDLVENFSESISYRSSDEPEVVNKRASRVLPRSNSYSQPKPRVFLYTFNRNIYEELSAIAQALIR